MLGFLTIFPLSLEHIREGNVVRGICIFIFASLYVASMAIGTLYWGVRGRIIDAFLSVGAPFYGLITVGAEVL